MEPGGAVPRLNLMGETGQLAAILAEQDGIVTTAQALACGLSRGGIRGRAVRGEWKRLAAGIYRSAEHDYGERAMVRAAALAHRGVLDRTTAAWWHGLVDTLAEPLTMSAAQAVPEQRWTGCAVDVVRRTFCAEDLTTLRGLDLTAKDLTVVGAVEFDPDPSRLLDRTLQRGEVTVDGLREAVKRYPRTRGMSTARALLAVLDEDTESAAERMFAQLLREEGIRGWIGQHPFEGWRLDFAWPEWKVAVEIDGWAFHCDPKAFRRDARKRNALIRAGWLPLSFTWHDLTEDRIGVAETVVSLLRTRALMPG